MLQRLLYIACLMFALILTSKCSSAQWLERQVFATAGQSAGEFTIGEVFTLTLEADAKLTQGFHQPTFTSVGVEENDALEFMVWPNPASDMLQVQSNGKNYQWFILDAVGKIVLEGHATDGQALDLSQLARGSYFLRIQESESLVYHTTQFIRQ